MQSRRPLRLVSFLLSLLVLACSLVALTRWQEIFDWWRLRDYEPPARIAQLATDTTMTSYGKKLFYVHYPELDDKAAFNQHCNEFEQSVVLGCYLRSRGIYIYDVQEPRLAGIQQVTAAHEMLHAAYDRLSSSERSRVDELTGQTFTALQDARVKQTIEQYRQRDVTVVSNELHSILATEVRDLPPELEAYYRKYFADRSKVVAFAEQYEGAFTERKQKVAAYDTQLKTLKSQIDSTESQLEADGDQLQSERQRLDKLLATRDYDTYNAGVDDFNAAVRSYNNRISMVEGWIAEYNQIIKGRNAIALEEQELIKALDSRLQTQTTQ